MKTPDLPDSLAKQIEAFRQRRGRSWAIELEKLLRKELSAAEWDEEVRRPGPKAAHFSEDEAEQLATEVVREARRERRK